MQGERWKRWQMRGRHWLVKTKDADLHNGWQQMLSHVKHVKPGRRLARSKQIAAGMAWSVLEDNQPSMVTCTSIDEHRSCEGRHEGLRRHSCPAMAILAT